MDLKFTKMHGCGNDYIYFNCSRVFAFVLRNLSCNCRKQIAVF
jgi:diaminopimelate epimerase